MDILEFINRVEGFRDEEIQASNEYYELASYAREIGLSEEIVNKIRDIAADEGGHFRFFETLHSRLQISTAHLQPSTVGKRRFPQTYDDWVSLAYDIKEKDKKIDTWAKVYECLNSIAFDEPDIDDAKRWLVDKAGELGIT